jgi:Amidohydrolase family
VTVEAYPYGVGSTVVGAAFFTDPEFPDRTGGGYDTIELLQSGKRLANRDELLAAQEKDPGSLILWHFLDVDVTPRHRDLLDVSVLFPGGAIASDAIAWMIDGTVYTGDAWPLPAGVVSHPRSAGTFTRFLSRWVRERQTMSLIEGLRKCTLIPAEILEAGTPQMRRKARIQPGCDADLVVFDYDELLDMAEFSSMNRPARGMRHVLVSGEAVIVDGNLRRNARPGRPVRREPR